MDLKNVTLNNSNYSDNIKNKRNSSVSRKKSDISAATIINSIERDISELMQEIAVRSQKNKLISISETLKLLSKKLLSSNPENSINNSLTNSNYKKINVIIYYINLFNKTNNFQDDEIRKNYELELKKLVEQKDNEILNLSKKRDSNILYSEADYLNLKKEKDEIILNLNSKIDQLSIFLSEEKSKNSQLLIKIKSLEETFKTLNNEYMAINMRYSKAQTESENYEKSLLEVRKNNHDNKNKFEDLIKINNDLKTRLIEYENTTKLHQDDLKNILKRNSNLQKSLDELEKINKQLNSDLSYKDERLKAIRFMNQKLEQKTQQILKKWDTFKRFEEKAIEITTNSNKMLEIIDELNQKLIQEIQEKETIKNSIETIKNEKFQLNSFISDLNLQITNLKSVNEELLNRNNNLEGLFRGNLDVKGEFKDSKENLKSNTLLKFYNKQNNSFQENINTNNYNNETFPIDKMNPAKIIINNNNVEIQH